MSRVVLITGCSTGGIGYSLCNKFATAGCKVYATARRIESMSGFTHPRISTLALDVTNERQVKEVVEFIAEKEGRLDIVVNNAGMMGIMPLIDATEEFLQTVFDTNCFSALRVARMAIPVMAKRKSGLIINIGSVVGETPTPWNGVYSASKAAMQSISEVLSMECRPFNIRVMHVSPAAIESNISSNMASRFELPETSLYKGYLHNIIERIHASQGSSRMAAAEFSKRVVGAALSKKPPRYMLLGGQSIFFKLFKWLPRGWVLWYLWRRYSQPKKV